MRNIPNHYEYLFVLLFFFIVAFFYLGANIFAGQIAAPMDILSRYPGFNESSLKLDLYNTERSDVLDYQIPIWTHFREQIINGEFPLWDPLRNGGVSGMLPHVSFIGLFFRADFLPFLIFGNGVGFTFSVIVKFVLVGFGTYLLCRKAFGIIPSVFAGLSLMMLPWMGVWINVNGTMSFALIPWVLWAILRVVEKPNVCRMIILALTVTMLAFGGVPYIGVLGLLIGLAFFVWLLILKHKTIGRQIKKAFGYGVVGIFLGLLLASVHIVPFMEWNENTDTSWRSSGSIFTIKDVDVLWDPFKYHNITSDHIVPKGELTGYVGILTLIFLPVALVSLVFNKKIIFTYLSPLFFVPIFIFIFILVFNIQPFSSYLYELPPFNNSSNSRAIGMLGLFLVILATFGLEQVIRKFGNFLKTPQKRVVLVFVLGLIIILSQSMDISRVGKAANAVVPAEAYFPLTPTLNYVQQNLLPGQSVIATNAYMVSGTLTGYMIPEWFALGYLNPEEKNVLSNLVVDAWRVPNAAAFTSANINFNSEYMEAFFVKFILIEKNDFDINRIPSKYEIIAKGEKIIILENKITPPGAYLIKIKDIDKKFDPNTIETGNTKLNSFNCWYCIFCNSDNNF